MLSTVRSNKQFLEQDKRFAIGFLGNEKRFNVAVTRPQAGLIIVGDPDILTLDPLWRRKVFVSLVFAPQRCLLTRPTSLSLSGFLLHIHDNGGWCGQEWDPTPFRDESFDPAQAARQEMNGFIERFGDSVNVDDDGDD